MTATRRLYFEDPTLLRFRARVLVLARTGDRPSVTLERTAFYPEAGGQMADRGVLGGAAVVDVQVDEEGVVHHILDEAGPPPPQPGEEIEGLVEWRRRRAHMALHTGQHLLSRALLDEAGAETVGSRLGETVCTVDLHGGEAEGDIARAEALANSVVDDDLPIRAWFPSPAELAAIALRREPKVERDVRVIAIGDFDASPCGGTHCTRSSQVGLIRVLSVERHEGGRRVSFEAGPRARDLLAAHSESLRTLGQSFSCQPGEVGSAVDRLRGELKTARDTLRARGERLADQLSVELVERAASSGGRAIAILDDADLDLLRAIAKRITARSGAVALLATNTGAGLEVVVSRGEGSTFDCGAFLKKAAAAAGARGGGRPAHAEGRLPAGSDWLALTAAA